MEKIIKRSGEKVDFDQARIKENSNMPFSYSGMMMHISGSIMANYTLDKIYPIEVADAHRNGDFHIHDLSLGIIGYCSGWSLKQLFMEGFNGVADKVESLPPKHLDTALLQMVNFLGTLQGEWAGAQAFNSVDTYLAPFVRKDKLSYDQVKQQIQKFIFNLNIASRWGGQAPFTNVTFDWVVPHDIADDPVITGGKPQLSSYKEYQDEMDMINRAFIEVMTINLPRIGYQVETEQEFMERLSHLMDLAKISLEIKMDVVNKNMNNGLVPLKKGENKMPIYEFKCQDCGKIFERNLPMSQSGKEQACSECGGRTQRVFSPVAIGGSSMPDRPEVNSSAYPSCPGGVCGL